jgi:hypothetical protein
MVYVGSDVALPLIEWRDHHPTMHVRPLESSEEAVRQHFKKAHVYYVGSHYGCGCGFLLGACEDGEDSAEAAAAVDHSLSDLAEYLNTYSKDGPLEMYVVKGGQEETAPTEHVAVHPRNIPSTEFKFKTGRMVTIEK